MTVQYSLGTREWRLRLPRDGTPAVEGTTSGLRAAACFPERITLLHYLDTGAVRAVCEGRRRRANGTPADTWVTVTVQIHGETGGKYSLTYPEAPQWLTDLYREVSA